MSFFNPSRQEVRDIWALKGTMFSNSIDGAAPIKMGCSTRKQAYKIFLRECSGDKARAEAKTVEIWDIAFNMPPDPTWRERIKNWFNQKSG